MRGGKGYIRGGGKGERRESRKEGGSKRNREKERGWGRQGWNESR